MTATTKLILILLSPLVGFKSFAQNDSLVVSHVKLSVDAQSLNYIGNFSTLNIEYDINKKISVGVSVKCLHNRAEIPKQEYVKIEHRFHAENFAERLGYGIHVGYKIKNDLFRFGEVRVVVGINYMNTTYRNIWLKYSRDTINRVPIFDVVNINNSNIHCIDFIGGINIKSKITGNLFLNSTVGAGLAYFSGFNKNDIGKTSLLKPNYLLSIGIGYRFSKR